MKYDYILWDFNGTIVDDVPIGIECVNEMLEKRGLPILQGREDYWRVFGFPIRDYYTRLGFDMEHGDSYEALAVEWVEKYRAKFPQAPLCEGVRDTLDAIRNAGIRQSVISANELGQLTEQLKFLGVWEEFEEVYGLDNIHAAGKMGLARAWREKHPDARALFIGDTDHDKEVADFLHADCILYAGGHQSGKYLATLGCPVVESFQGLLRLFASQK